MTMTEDSKPNRTIRQRNGAAGGPVRASDAERDTALRTLAAHFADGRLNRGEFDQRADAALAARTQSDLDTLFADLPGTAPAPANAPASARTGRRHGAFPLPLIAPLLVVLTIAAAAHGFPLFSLIPVLFILSRRNRRWHRGGPATRAGNGGTPYATRTQRQRDHDGSIDRSSSNLATSIEDLTALQTSAGSRRGRDSHRSRTA